MEPLSNNFILTEKSSTSILLKFWGYFWLQDFRGSKKGSIYVCRNLPMSHLVQFKAWKWGFGWYSNLQARRTWIFQISRLAHKVWWILGAPIWAPKSPKFYFHKLQKKLKIFQFYHVYSKCTSFDVCNPKSRNAIRFLTMMDEFFVRTHTWKLFQWVFWIM